MAEGTRFAQLADSLAAVKQIQDQSQQNFNTLQEVVQGLAQKLDVVASHVEALVQMKAAQNSGDPGGSTQITNPLFEDHTGIQTRAVRLDFPKFNGDNPKVGYIGQTSFLTIIKPIPIIGFYWHLSIWKEKP